MKADRSACDVARCARRPVIVVTFRATPFSDFAYCERHGFDRDGAVRWKSTEVEHVEHLRGT